MTYQAQKVGRPPNSNNFFFHVELVLLFGIPHGSHFQVYQVYYFALQRVLHLAYLFVSGLAFPFSEDTFFELSILFLLLIRGV